MSAAQPLTLDSMEQMVELYKQQLQAVLTSGMNFDPIRHIWVATMDSSVRATHRALTPKPTAQRAIPLRALQRRKQRVGFFILDDN